MFTFYFKPCDGHMLDHQIHLLARTPEEAYAKIKALPGVKFHCQNGYAASIHLLHDTSERESEREAVHMNAGVKRPSE